MFVDTAKRLPSFGHLSRPAALRRPVRLSPRQRPEPNRRQSTRPKATRRWMRLDADVAKGTWGHALAERDLAKTPLTKADAAKARESLWKQHAALIAKEREPEISAGVLKLNNLEMPIYLQTYGKEPKEGWSRWISMHGGGGAPKAVNDQQWEESKAPLSFGRGHLLRTCRSADEQLESVARRAHRQFLRSADRRPDRAQACRSESGLHHGLFGRRRRRVSVGSGGWPTVGPPPR